MALRAKGWCVTANNFGLLSTAESSSAARLAGSPVRRGRWSVKKLHRRIMLSAAYQRASAIPRSQFAQDPDNRWLGRFPARRLEAEAIRDAMIFVSGRLDLSPGGPAGPM